MCRSSNEAGGPRRCSGDARDSYSQAVEAVAQLQRSEAALAAGMRQRREIDAAMGVEAAGYVRTWMESHGLSEIHVDDVNETSCHALDVDAPALDAAISLLPPQMISKTTHPAGNPVVRLSDLTVFLTARGGEDHHLCGPGDVPSQQGDRNADTATKEPSMAWNRRGRDHVAAHPEGGEYWVMTDWDMIGRRLTRPRLYWVWGKGEDDFADMGEHPDLATAIRAAEDDAAAYARIGTPGWWQEAQLQTAANLDKLTIRP